MQNFNNDTGPWNTITLLWLQFWHFKFGNNCVFCPNRLCYRLIHRSTHSNSELNDILKTRCVQQTQNFTPEVADERLLDWSLEKKKNTVEILKFEKMELTDWSWMKQSQGFNVSISAEISYETWSVDYWRSRATGEAVL